MTLSQFRWLPSLRELDEEQRDVIYNSLNKGSNLVYGPAGCGKTAITLYCAKSLRDTNKKFIVFLYTNTLLRFIRAATQELEIPDERVKSFYSWVWHQYHAHIGYPPSNGNDKYSRWVNGLIQLFQTEPDVTPRFDFILVDEAQDFKPNVSRLLHMMSDNVFIAGDTSQSLYNNLGQMKELIDLWSPLNQNFELVNNYRNPRSVAQVAALFLDGSSLSAEEFLRRVKGRDYEMKPVWYQVDSPADQTDKIIELIQQARGSERIGILYRRKSEMDAEISRLVQQGIQFQVARSNSASYSFNNSLPTLTTMHSAKGLEFDWVILPYLNRNIWDGRADDIQQRRLFFVALTRTKSNLYLISLKNQACAYLREITAYDPNLLQSPSGDFAATTAAQPNFDDYDDPF
jgi:DNA helicase-4